MARRNQGKRASEFRKSVYLDQIIQAQYFAQAHHFAKRFNVAPPTGEPRWKTSGAMLTCPLCSRMFTFDEFSREHIPQNSPKNPNPISLLGRYKVDLATCQACNHRSGKTFESTSARIRNDAALKHQSCVLNGGQHVGVTSSGMIFYEDVRPLMLADLKSAFLMAWAVLGYSYALSVRLTHIREALVAGRVVGPTYARWVRIRCNDRSLDNTVIEIEGNSPCVAVHGEGGAALLLPAPAGNIDVPRTLGNVSVRVYRWPDTTQGKPKVHLGLARSGLLFHGDFCPNHRWPGEPHGTHRARRSSET